MSFPKGILKSKWTKVIAFFITLFFINQIMIFVLCPKGTYERSTMKDMYSLKLNADVVFAGSSYTVRGINPYIMDDKMQKNTLDYAFDGQIYIGTYYSLKELFKYHKPETIVLSTDWNNYTNNAESELYFGQVFMNMKPSLNKLQYYIAESKQDNSFLSRYFLWTKCHSNVFTDIMKNVKVKSTSKYRDYPKYGKIDSDDKERKYMGKGFVSIDSSIDEDRLDENKLGKMDLDKTDTDKINPKNIEYFKKIADLCKKNNCKLILVQFPVPVYEILREKNYFKFDEKISEYAKEQDVPYYNFNLLKPDIFKTDISDFHDRFHLNDKGAEKFSNFLADFLNKRNNGEDVDNMFETSDDYFNSVDYITNTWFNAKIDGNKINLKADSLYGPKVIPEYQFVLTDTNTGDSSILKDYSKDSELTTHKPDLDNYKITVYAREQGSSKQYSCYYEQKFRK